MKTTHMNIHRQFVPKTVKPFITPEILANIKEDLKTQDWYAVGDGSRSTGSEGWSLIITQRETDPERFDIVIDFKTT